MRNSHPVIPAEAGTQELGGSAIFRRRLCSWVPDQVRHDEKDMPC